MGTPDEATVIYDLFYFLGQFTRDAVVWLGKQPVGFQALVCILALIVFGCWVIMCNRADKRDRHCTS